VTTLAATTDTEHPVRSFWRARRWELVGAVVFVTFVAWPFLRRSRLVASFDHFTYGAPSDAVTFDALRHFRLAQWNPSIFGGVPQLANSQAGQFNPLKLPFIWLTPWRAVMLITALHLLVLAVGMVVLAHRLRLRCPAGFVAAAAVVGSGMVAVKSMQYPQLTVIAGVPWLLAAIDLALDRPARPRRAVAWLALATAFLCVSGHPQMTFLAIALAGAWTLSRVLWHSTWRHLGLVAGGALLGGALAAAQLLPSLALLDGAAQHGDFARDPAYVLDPARLASMLFSDIGAARPWTTAGAGDAAAYVGVVATVLALIGIVDTLRRRRARAATVVLLVTAAISVSFAEGDRSPLFRVARDVVPLFDQARVPARWTVLVTFIAAVLAAMGTDAVMARRFDRRTVVAVIAVIAVVLLLVAADVLARPRSGAVLSWVVLTLVALGALAFLARATGRGRVLGVVIVVVLVVVELGTMASKSPARSNTVPATYAGITGPAVDYLHSHGEGRVIAMTQERTDDVAYLLEGLRPNVNADRDLRSVDGYDGGPQVRTTWLQLVRALTVGPIDPDLTLRAQPGLTGDPERWARYGVRYALVDTSVVPGDQLVPGWRLVVNTSGPLQLYENPAWTGDAFVYRATRRVVREPGRVIRAMSADQLEEVALVGPDGPRLECTSDCDRRPAPVARDTPEHLVVHASASTRSLLAVTEQWDRGWSVQVDGHDAPVVQVDGFMLGVELPRGHHTIVFRYHAPGLRAGLVISLFAALAVVVLLVTGRRRVATSRPV
jgi:hypothetical protein